MYNEERTYQQDEEKKKNDSLYGNAANGKKEESKVANPDGTTTIAYRNRIERLNDLVGQKEGDEIDREDHII